MINYTPSTSIRMDEDYLTDGSKVYSVVLIAGDSRVILDAYDGAHCIEMFEEIEKAIKTHSVNQLRIIT